ncbi:MAG: MBL fold metallo-hydrolase [Gammaproteobacteria bacterium]|nr:MBL fold metallo-hydrolase [Gammaproteobacteria bacterium]MBT4193005.1 MBL fold metallo-hydrolase [Gammaproteobacteria bacterium]MBT4861101.1 MBL fold metallo-hydrolase [Gammaproteobacteria bacterium]MBT6453943.1 MBL fold metallo-hydrolase [Gammaproteobacteria bacterium]MBT6702775.1 MBL fold metallo-hydrolase [Gammaproteobacteria bacterium]
MSIKKIITILLISLFNPVSAENLRQDELKLQQVTENVYAIVGSMENRTADNLGNNSTFGFVVTTQGVVLIDSGGTYQGAKRIHKVIKQVTDKSVVTVINTGGQDHRWLGNGYFKKLGAKIIANDKAVEDQKARLQEQIFMLNNVVGLKGVDGTEAVFAENLFDTDMKISVGETKLEIYHAGPAHTPSDSFVWLPEQQVIFSGDIVFTERLLGILDHSSSKDWIRAFEAMAAFNPRYIIPGHGHPTTLDKAKSDTYDYLKFIRQAVTQFMDNDGDIADISMVNQSAFSSLLSFDLLSGRNAQRVYSELEWE